MSTTKPRQRGSSITRVDLPSGPRWRFRLDLEPDPDTGRRRQRTLTFRTEGEAVEAQSKLRVDVAQRTYTEPSKVTLNEYLDGWLLAGQRTWRPSTLRSYTLALKPVRDALGRRKVQQIGRADIERLTASMLASGGRRKGQHRSPRTVALALTILSKALKDAVHDELIPRNPAEHVRKPRTEHREMSTWTPDEVRSFLAHVDADPLVGAWHLTMRGLRRGEVCGLRWSDIDFTGKTLTIRQARVEVGSQVVTGAPKTARGRRTLPLDDELARALRLTRERTVTDAQVVPLRQRGTDERLIVVDGCGEPLRPEVYGDLFARHAKAAGLPPIRLHDARHTALTLLLQQGVPVHVVARFAGHDPSVTLRTYAHVQADALKAAGDALGALYAGRL